MSAVLSAPRKRSPSIVFGCISVAILLLMMTALNQAQPPPPPTPEYAPEAVQAVKNPPPDQTSQAGKGPQGTEGGAPGSLPTPGPTYVDERRVRKCIGASGSERQIEDTQSPPCVPYWDPQRDNGGRTWAGVTKDEIRIGVPGGFAWENRDLFRYLVTFFNRRFEFYGRKLVPIQIDECGGWKPQDMQECAQSARAAGIFASTSYVDVGGNQQFYYDALARFGILSVSSHPDRRTEAHLAANAPYQWSYLPTLDKVGAHLASLVCSQLMTPGAKATHGGPDVVTKARKIGLVYNTLPDSPPMDTSAFTDGLKSCGVTPSTAAVKYVKEGYGYQGTDDESVRDATNAVVGFRTSDVTTIVCLCHSTTTKYLMASAEGQGYQPEWVLSSYAYHTSNLFMTSMPAAQSAHTFGVDFWNKVVRPENEPWYWASQEVKPDYNYEGNPAVYFGAMFIYHQLLLLASGIQMAGPNLTPGTFQAGLWKANFPNPPGPYFEGKAGFKGRDHSMVDDAAIIWWDPSGRDPWIGSQGAFCYVRRGERSDMGGYPGTDELFKGSRGERLCDR